MVAADPEHDRLRRIVHEHATNVRRPGKQILRELAGPRIEAKHTIGELPSRPHLAVLVRGDIVGPGLRGWRNPFLEAFRPRVEHADSLPMVLAEPQPVLRVHHAAAWPRTGRRRRMDRD